MSLRLARTVIVPSRATANELAQYTRRPADRFTVIYHGVDGTVFHAPSPAEIAAATEALGLGARPWIAFLGTIEPRKNVPALVRAYCGISTSAQLAIAGGAGWETGLVAELDRVEPPAEVRLLGFVDIRHLAGFLGGAEIVVYPSSGEGFGLPVLEAMSCGAAVLTTRELALPEVGGEAVAYCEPNAPSIASALDALLSDPARRESLRVAGMARAATFTWRAAADAHERAYSMAAEGKN